VTGDPSWGVVTGCVGDRCAGVEPNLSDPNHHVVGGFADFVLLKNKLRWASQPKEIAA
jgi:hypothetical protein